jgi:hypothetical protein
MWPEGAVEDGANGLIARNSLNVESTTIALDVEASQDLWFY